MVSKSSITLQSLGEIEPCALAVGAKMWSLYVYFFFCHPMSPVHCSFGGGVYFEQLLWHCLWVDFDSVFILFFRSDCPFRGAKQFLVPLLVGANFFWRNCGQKLQKVQKSAEKFVRHTSCR